jgi:hypothetical protein
MSLYDRCVDLQLRLEAAQSADTSLELLTRGDRLVEGLDRASEYFDGVAAFRSKLGISSSPALDSRAMTQAVAAFRAGLSRHSSSAFQHQPATSLVELANVQRDRTARWVGAQWKGLFAAYEPLLERVETGRLVGSRSHCMVAQARAAKLRAARGMDPVRDAAELPSMLSGVDITAWIASIESVGDELRQALEALDDERQALTPAVRGALESAASDGGLPLSELNADLLAALRAAGVVEHLVVRRR